METDLMNSGGKTELSPVFAGQVSSYVRLTCGERPLAAPGLNATGDPEEEEEEEEEEKKKGEEDEEEEENDGEEEEVPWQVTVPCPSPQPSPHYHGARECF
jgi:hypothetical protein